MSYDEAVLKLMREGGLTLADAEKVAELLQKQTATLRSQVASQQRRAHWYGKSPGRRFDHWY